MRGVLCPENVTSLNLMTSRMRWKMSLSSSVKLLTNPRCRVAGVAPGLWEDGENSGGGRIWKRQEGVQRQKDKPSSGWVGMWASPWRLHLTFNLSASGRGADDSADSVFYKYAQMYSLWCDCASLSSLTPLLPWVVKQQHFLLCFKSKIKHGMSSHLSTP